MNAIHAENVKPVQKFGPIACLLSGVAIAMCYGLVGKGDYEQAVADQKLDCQMVQIGAWPKRSEEKCGAPVLRKAPAQEERVANL